MDLDGIEPSSQQCECCVLPLNHRPTKVIEDHRMTEFYKILSSGRMQRRATGLQSHI